MAKLQSGSELIFRVAIALPVYRLFDYLAPEQFEPALAKPGVRLQVPFGKANKIAFLVECVQHSDIDLIKLKRVERILDEKPLLSAKDLALLHWAGGYYHHPLGEVFSAAFPVALRQGKAAVMQTEKRYALTELGKTIDSELLKRAPKQKAYWKSFKPIKTVYPRRSFPHGIAIGGLRSNRCWIGNYCSL